MTTTGKLTTHWPSITPNSSTYSIGPAATGNMVWNNTNTTTKVEAPSLQIKGDADFKGDILLQGKSLSETLDKIHERLNILVPNKELEAEYAELAALRQQYVELEQKLQEKQRVFNILKKR